MHRFSIFKYFVPIALLFFLFFPRTIAAQTCCCSWVEGKIKADTCLRQDPCMLGRITTSSGGMTTDNVFAGEAVLCGPSDPQYKNYAETVETYAQPVNTPVSQTATGKPRLTLPDPIIKIPGLEKFSNITETACPDNPNNKCLVIPWMAQYFSAVYTFSMGAGAILATIMIIFGGALYVTSAGSPDRITSAKSYITSAIFGFLLLLGSYLLLYTVNPALVRIGGLPIQITTGAPSQSDDTLDCSTSFIQQDQTKAAALSLTLISSEKISPANGVILFMEPNAAAAFINMANAFGNVTINSMFRSEAHQACLNKTLGSGIANAAGTSSHENGTGVDISTSGMSTDTYKKLLQAAEANNFCVATHWKSSSIPDNWNTVSERWHFTYGISCQ